METIRVVIADDHALVRAGIRALLERSDGIDVTAEAGDGLEALAQIDKTRPHVALIDISMPNLNGLEMLGRVTHEWPRVRSIMLSVHRSEEYVLEALSAGAAGYLLKSAERPELELAIRSAARGDRYICPAVSRPVLDQYTRSMPRSAERTRLTARQREILQLVAEGRTTKEIAQRLELSAKTVETHRSELMSRLEIHDVAGLVRYAIRAGLVSLDA